MKAILFIEKDADISEALCDFTEQNLPEQYTIRKVARLDEADEILRRETFDGILLDALQPSLRNLEDFIRKVRQRDYRLPMVALVGYHDMILNPTMKETLQKARVSITDKVNALKGENIERLLQNVCDRGFGEELN